MLKVALVGNPNCGKTSLFNILTGLNQKTGNYSGVTVDKKSGRGRFNNKEAFSVIDLPGTYSLFPNSEDEELVYKTLIDKEGADYPDKLLIVVDASNLSRNLLLCTQVLDLKIPTIIALNMNDEALNKGLAINIVALSKCLGVDVFSINARTGKGVNELKENIKHASVASVNHFNTEKKISLSALSAIKLANKLNTDFAAYLYAGANKVQIDDDMSLVKIQSEEVISRYKLINSYVEKSLIKKGEDKISAFNRNVDRFLTHGFWGYAIFLLLMFLMFQAIFSWAEYPMDIIELGFNWLRQLLSNHLPVNFFTKLLLEGIIPGISGICVFIPQIALLFGFVAILEDTGYMSRVSFIMDGLMRKMGLSGKSIIPLVGGFACAVPAIMSARGISNWKEKIITIMITPLMSCSARIPVYLLLTSLIVPDDNYVLGIFNTKGIIMMTFYLLGIGFAIIIALLMQLIIKQERKTYFVLELPNYKIPRWGNVTNTMYQKSKDFVFEAGKIILLVAIVLYILASSGPQSFYDVDAKYTSIKSTKEQRLWQAEKLENSYIGYLGKSIEPAIRPLGFDWKIGIALITSFAAREVFVGTMATIYSIGDDEDNLILLKDKLRTEINPHTLKPVYGIPTAISLMIFYALAMQCMSTLAIVKRETKSWKWPFVQFLYMSVLAYLASFVAYQLLV